MPFSGKQLLPGEKLIIFARQHAIVLFKPLILTLIVLVLLSGLSVYSHKAWFLAFSLVPLIYFLFEYTAWHNKQYVLTNRRVIKLEGVFSTVSFDVPLDKINNVFHKQSFMGRLLKYGEVGLETASDQGTTIFSVLSNPMDFKNHIVQQRESYRSNTNTAGVTDYSGIPRLLEKLASLRNREIISESEFQEKKRDLLKKI